MTQRANSGDGGAEICTALGENRRLFVLIGLFSAFVNLLTLIGIRPTWDSHCPMK